MNTIINRIFTLFGLIPCNISISIPILLFNRRYIDTFSINDELDEDYMEVWESMKIEKARQRYPEAQRFYFEDSRAMQRLIDAEINGWREDDDEEIDEWGEIEDDGNMPCDYSGFCAGTSCPMFWKCQH